MNPPTQPKSFLSRCGQSLLACLLALVVGGLPPAAFAQQDPASVQEGGSVPVAGLLPEPRVIARAIDYAARRLGDGTERRSGMFLELGNMISGAGWITVGPGYRQWLFADRVLAEGSAAYSWRGYKMAQARIELARLAHGRVAVGTQARWQDLTQITFFGDGPDSHEADRSEYRLKALNLVSYVGVRPSPWLSVDGRIRWLARPSLLAPAGPFKRGNPSASDVFPEHPVFNASAQPTYLYGDLSITADTRDHRSYPSKGSVYRAAWVRYADRDTRVFAFDRFEAETAHFVPVANRRLVLALHGWLAASRAADGHPYRCTSSQVWVDGPRCGVSMTTGSTTGAWSLSRARSAWRSSRMWTRLCLSTPAPLRNAWQTSTWPSARTGIGLRIHSERATFGRLEAAHGSTGWRVFFNLRDPIHLSRLQKRTAAIPFVP